MLVPAGGLKPSNKLLFAMALSTKVLSSCHAAKVVAEAEAGPEMDKRNAMVAGRAEQVSVQPSGRTVIGVFNAIVFCTVCILRPLTEPGMLTD